jgi:C_GCAxxG_C_C family probable redox protein
MDKVERAVQQFMDGFRCSQVVLEAFCEKNGLAVELARKISLGLAGGAGCRGECGAVEGAYLVNGLRYGFTEPGNPDGFQKLMGKNQDFADEFKKLHGSLGCFELLGVDIFTEEGLATFKAKEMKKEICAKLVGDAVRILEKIG